MGIRSLFSFRLSRRAPSDPAPFQGVGVYFTSEVHAASGTVGADPTALVEALATILDYQQRIIGESGGIVEQFVGDCVIAYWTPDDLENVLPRVSQAAGRIIREKPPVARLGYRLAVHFCAADLVGAFFGPANASRFQIMGQARSRAESLPRSIPGQDCVLTDPDTVASMPLPLCNAYLPISTTAYALTLRP